MELGILCRFTMPEEVAFLSITENLDLLKAFSQPMASTFMLVVVGQLETYTMALEFDKGFNLELRMMVAAMLELNQEVQQ